MFLRAAADGAVRSLFLLSIAYIDMRKVMLLPFRLISVTVLLKVILPVYTPGVFKHPYFMLRLGKIDAYSPENANFGIFR
jgi:hypothetical protein